VRQARAFLDDVARSTIASATELLVGVVEGAFSDGVADMMGAEMARGGVRVRVVLWHEDLGACAAKQRKALACTRLALAHCCSGCTRRCLRRALKTRVCVVSRAVRVLELLERARGGRGVPGACVATASLNFAARAGTRHGLPCAAARD
jgi:hypothetical protein